MYACLNNEIPKINLKMDVHGTRSQEQVDDDKVVYCDTGR